MKRLKILYIETIENFEDTIGNRRELFSKKSEKLKKTKLFGWDAIEKTKDTIGNRRELFKNNKGVKK